MSGLLNLCREYFDTDNLYEILDIEKTATQKEVKKAYYKLSMKVHPDRVQEDEKIISTEKFKVLGQIHSILKDDKKKALYDETGRVDDDSEASVANWMDYWRQMFQKITIEDIQSYEQKYKGSEEELNDLKKAYLTSKGDLDYIHEKVLFLSWEDEPRIIEIVKELINKGEVPEYNIFTHEPAARRMKRHNKYKREAQLAKKILAKKLKANKDCNTETDLMAVIQKRNQERSENFLDALAEKYAAKEKRPKKTGKSKRLSGKLKASK